MREMLADRRGKNQTMAYLDRVRKMTREKGGESFITSDGRVEGRLRASRAYLRICDRPWMPEYARMETTAPTMWWLNQWIWIK